jgi:hypothetical protein
MVMLAGTRSYCSEAWSLGWEAILDLCFSFLYPRKSQFSYLQHRNGFCEATTRSAICNGDGFVSQTIKKFHTVATNNAPRSYLGDGSNG